MTLTNPTDDELNRAFAIYVVECGPEHPAYDGHNYCGSFDAVLPWLEKWAMKSLFAPVHYTLLDGTHSIRLQGAETVKDKTIPRAAVIALLGAHGVEVIFT